MSTAAGYSSSGDRITSVTDATGAAVSYAYGTADAQMLGLPTAVTDPNGTVTATTYDTLGRVSQTGISGLHLVADLSRWNCFHSAGGNA